jgi:hypothetical protein
MSFSTSSSRGVRVPVRSGILVSAIVSGVAQCSPGRRRGHCSMGWVADASKRSNSATSQSSTVASGGIEPGWGRRVLRSECLCDRWCQARRPELRLTNLHWQPRREDAR